MQQLHKKLPELNFQNLRTFLSLAETGNFSRTGEQVGLSQSAVSRHIRALEDSLGLRLFERLGRRAVLTSGGHAMRTRLETLVREAESLPRLLRDLAEGVQGEVRIGASITAANSILPPLLGDYRRRYPSVELALQPANSARVLESLARGEIDLAIVGSDALPSRTAVLAEIPDEVLLVAPREHPFAGRRMKSVELAGCDFIQREATSDTRALVANWFRAEGVHPRNIMEVG
jgi:DNA-binding transcriptional LysR family regulator